MKNSQKGFVIPLLIVIIGVLIVGGGIYFYKQKGLGSSSAVASQQLIDTSSWSTYTSQEYGFSFKYPTTMQVDDISQTDKYGPVEIIELVVKYTSNPTTNNRINILVRDKSQIGVLKNVLGNLKSTSNIQPGGVPMQLFDSYVSQGNATFETAVFEIGNSGVSVVYRSDDPVLSPYFYTMLSTFR